MNRATRLLYTLQSFAGATPIVASGGGSAPSAPEDLALAINDLLCDSQGAGIHLVPDSPDITSAIYQPIGVYDALSDPAFPVWGIVAYVASTVAVADAFRLRCVETGITITADVPNTGGDIRRLDLTWEPTPNAALNERRTFSLALKSDGIGSVRIESFSTYRLNRGSVPSGSLYAIEGNPVGGLLTDYLSLDQPVTPDMLHDAADLLTALESRSRELATLVYDGRQITDTKYTPSNVSDLALRCVAAMVPLHPPTPFDPFRTVDAYGLADGNLWVTGDSAFDEPENISPPFGFEQGAGDVENVAGARIDSAFPLFGAFVAMTDDDTGFAVTLCR